MNFPKGLKIALCGCMRSGKDSVGAYLISEYGFKRYALGDGIVQITKELFPQEYESGIKPRKLLQEFGQYCVTQIDSEVWVRHMFTRMERDGINLDEDNIVITDMRQPHEYDALVERGFTIVRINVSQETQHNRMKELGEPIEDRALQHITERFTDEFEVDFELNNDSDLETLHSQVKYLIRYVTGGEFR